MTTLRGLGEGRLGRGLVADVPVVDDVARRFRMQLRRARLDRGADIGDGRQLLVVDHDGFGRVLGLVLGLGDHDRDRLADEAHRCPAPSPAMRPSSSASRPWSVIAQPQIRLPILSSTISAPVSTPTTPGIFIAADVSMLLTLAWACGLRTKWAWVMPGTLDVVDVAALAGDETPVFLAHDACADAFNAHVLLSLPEFDFRRFHRNSAVSNRSRSRRRLFGRLRNLHASGGIEHRLDDVVVAGAAADVAFELVRGSSPRRARRRGGARCRSPS